MKTKRCWRCKETKPVSEFYKNRSKKDGLQDRCKGCTQERDRRYYENNKEKVMEKNRRYQAANPEKVRKGNSQWYKDNKAQCNRTRSRCSREENERSLEVAHRNGLPWEDWEDKFVLADNGLTIYQKAVKLGRSFYSVRNRKRKLLVTS